MLQPEPGQGITRSFLPDRCDTADAVGNAGVKVVATVTMILWIEDVCGDLIADCLEAGESSVGFRVAVDHVAPAHVGRPVEINVRVRETQGRKVSFTVETRQDGRTVMTGEHTRVVVDLARFLHADPGSDSSDDRESPNITFYFDVHSPWSYLASYRIGRIGRMHGIDVRWRPVHLANLIERIDGMRPLEQSPARVAWYMQDVVDQMSVHGLPYDPHPDYPLRPSRALRVCVFAAKHGCEERFVKRVMRGYWAEKEDISGITVLQMMAEQSGMNGCSVERIVNDDVYKNAVITNTNEAIESGAFGVPTFIYGDKVYFGCDRIDLLDRDLGRATISAGSFLNK